MKVAYISTPWFADVDLSYLSSLRDKCDVDYYLILLPSWTRVTAINIKSFYNKSGIFNTSIYPELFAFEEMIDLSRTYIVNINSHSYHSLTAFSVFYKLYIQLRKKRYNVIHHTTIPDYNRYILYMLRKKSLFSFHDPIPHSSDTSFVNRINRWLCLKLGNSFLLYNQSQKEDFISTYRLHKKKVYISKLGAYTYLKAFDQERIVKGKYILFFGGISPYKGLEFLFPSMVDVHEKFPDVKLVVAGKGKFYFDISEYEKLPYFVFMNRFVEDKDLSTLIRDSEFVVAPYKDATQSGVVMSAFALNKPCVVTEVGGLPEMVKDGQMGVVVPPCDTKSLTIAICSLLKDENERNVYADNINASYFKGDNSWDVITNGMIKIYKKVVDGHK